jgi:hypothetical protein
MTFSGIVDYRVDVGGQIVIPRGALSTGPSALQIALTARCCRSGDAHANGIKPALREIEQM